MAPVGRVEPEAAPANRRDPRLRFVLRLCRDSMLLVRDVTVLGVSELFEQIAERLAAWKMKRLFEIAAPAPD